jgi:hypothetical protein
MPTKEEKEIAARLYGQYKAEKAGELPEELVSREFRVFTKKKAIAGSLYEQLSQISGKFFKVSVPPAQKAEYDEILRSFDMSITTEDTQSFAILALVFSILLGTVTLLLSPLFGIVFIAVGFFGFLYLRNYPARLIQVRRAKASTEIILAVLYIVIYMKTVSNLESAIRFAAENLEGPLSVDLKKILWDVQTKKFADVQEALNTYLQQWKKYNEAFVDSIYLIETSLVQTSEDRRIGMLEQALKRILDGTYETMVHYVNDLRTPISAVFMLGITLPIMGLVMLPLIGAFLAGAVNPETLFVFYDVVLPLGVIAIIMQILATRPTAFPQIDLTGHPLVPKEDHFEFAGRLVHAAIPAVIIFVILALPYFWYAVAVQDPFNPSENDVLFSLFLILAIGVSITVYAKLASGIRVKIRQQIKAVERDFSYAVFQIGNRLSEGVPAEIAMLKTAQIMKDSSVSNFIRQIADNMAKLGLDLKRAIFDSKYGAILLYPSSMIRSVMKIFIQSTKESQEIAAASLTAISSYLLSVHNIEEKIKDVLSETLSTLKFQSSFIAPLISGIIVGLTSMILIILSVLGQKITAATGAAGGGPEFGGGAGGLAAFGFFELSNTIPLPVFQLIVGIYLVEIVIISTLLASKIEYGDDRIQELDSIGKDLIIAVVIYFFVALGVTIAFAGLAKIAVALGEF